MNKSAISQTWDYLRIVNGVGLRAIALLPDGQLDSHPIANMRTPKELVVHMYQVLEGITAGTASGQLLDFGATEKAVAGGIKTTAELVAWCRARWDASATNVAGLTDVQIQGIVKTPWGQDFPGFVLIQTASDEYWHHRGQLYCYLRALGVTPPSLYDFGHNEPGFEQKQKAGA